MNTPVNSLFNRLLRITVLAVAMWSSLGQATQFNLAVGNGTGSGSYEEGATVYLAANPYESADQATATSEPLDPLAADRIFDRWSGNIEALEDEFAARTTLLMPPADIDVTATYKDVPRWLPARVISSFPPNHRAVIFWFHGSFGDSLGAYSSIETRAISKEAASRGFAVVAINSFDRSIKRWDLTHDAAQNPDMQRVAEVRNSLINQGVMRLSDPVFVLGISNGGKFASLWNEENQVALGFPVEAAALYISSGETEVLETSTVPTIFALGVNDSQLDYKLNLGAQQAFDSLISRDVPAQLWMNHPSPITPERFWGITGLTRDDSIVIHDALQQNGLLDADNFLIDNPFYNTQWESVVPDEYEDYLGELEWHLACAYAEHAVMLKFTDKVLNFFDDPTTYIGVPPVVTDFTPASGYAGTPVEISGENFYGVTDVRFNGVSAADFTVVAGTLIGLQVPAGATTGPVEVINAIGTGISVSDFEVLPPMITAIAPTAGPVGTAVEITGEGFTDITEVTFNGVPAEILQDYFTTLWVTVPAGATTGPIQVSNTVGTATSAEDFQVSGPEIVTVEPTSGRVDSAVNLTGSGFGELLEVRFGGVSVTDILFSDDTQVWVRVPAGAVTGDIEVVTSGGVGISAEPFTVIMPPTISGFSPNRAPVGTVVEINGSGFDTTTLVRLGGVDDANFEIVSDTLIRATLPAGAKTSKILVANLAGYVVSGGYLIVTR